MTCMVRSLSLLSCFILPVLLISCSRKQVNSSPQFHCQPSMRETGCFLVLLVDAKHLDYSDNHLLLKSMVKHPDTLSKNNDVGHAWIYLRGTIDGQSVELEGGHSGELGQAQVKYFDGVMNYIEYGYANPTEEEKRCPRCEPNPIKYLWTSLGDGFYQEGPGMHRPTFAAKVDITHEQFRKILEFIDPFNYHYPDYALTRNQCTTFVAQVAALIDLSLEYEVTIPIDQKLTLCGETYQLWTDPLYSQITFPSPDILECSLKDLVAEGNAEYALDWYQKHRPRCFQHQLRDLSHTVTRFPERLIRYLCL